MPELQEVLKEFVLRLGYSEDESSKRRFIDSIRYMTVKVTELGLAVAAAATAVVAGVAKIASTMELLYYSASDTKSSIGDIKALQHQFEQLGGSAEQAGGLMAGMAKAVRENPGFKELIESFTHVPYKDAATSMVQLEGAFKKMYDSGVPAYQILAQMKSLNLDDSVFQVWARGWQKSADGIHTVAEAFRAEALRIQEAIIGSDAKVREYAENSVKFMNTLRTLGETAEGFMTKIAGEMEPGITKSMNDLQASLEKHAPEIEAVLIKIGTFFTNLGTIGGDAFLGIISGFSKLAGAYDKLDPKTKDAVEWVVKLAEAYAVIKFAAMFGLAGGILALAGAIGYLYDDYTKWKKDGNDKTVLIPWAKETPVINALATALNALGTALIFYVDGMKAAKAIGDLSRFGSTSYNFDYKLPEASKEVQDRQDIAAGRTPAPEPKKPWSIGNILHKLLYPQEESEQQEQLDAAGQRRFRQPGAGRIGANEYGGAAAGTGGGAANLNSSKIKEAVDILRGLGYSAAAAAGIVGNLYAESGLNPGIANASNHYGIAQWDQRRQLDFYNWKGRDIHGSTLREQLEFLDYELKGKEAATGFKLSSPSLTAGGAAKAMAGTERYENWQDPNNPETAKRVGLANQIAGGGSATGTGMLPGLSVNPAPVGSQAASISVVQHNSVVVNGAGDPKAVGGEVAARFRQMNADAYRNAAVAAR